MGDMEAMLINWLMEHDCYWVWDEHRHVAELTSGKLSNGYINCTPIFTDPQFQDKLGRELAKDEGLPTRGNKWVIGSAMGAIGLAQSIARFRSMEAAFTEPVDGNMVLKRFNLGGKPYVVLCEDVITTGGTTCRTMAAILTAHQMSTFIRAFSVS